MVVGRCEREAAVESALRELIAAARQIEKDWAHNLSRAARGLKAAADLADVALAEDR